MSGTQIYQDADDEYEVVELSEDELDKLVTSTLAGLGVEIGSLRQQAKAGRFDSEELRRAWFLIAGIGRG